MMRKLALAVVTVAMLGVTGCDAKTLEITSCALQDSRLSIAFEDPRRARQYMRELANGLEHHDPAAVEDAADLVVRLVNCLPGD